MYTEEELKLQQNTKGDQQMTPQNMREFIERMKASMRAQGRGEQDVNQEVNDAAYSILTFDAVQELDSLKEYVTLRLMAKDRRFVKYLDFEKHVLTDERLKNSFLQYLNREHTGNELEFIIKVDDWKNAFAATAEEGLRERANTIVELYVNPDSEQAVNHAGPPTYRALLGALSSGSDVPQSLFDDLRTLTVDLLKLDIFQRYISVNDDGPTLEAGVLSDRFSAVLEEIKKEEAAAVTTSKPAAEEENRRGSRFHLPSISLGQGLRNMFNAQRNSSRSASSYPTLGGLKRRVSSTTEMLRRHSAPPAITAGIGKVMGTAKGSKLTLNLKRPSALTMGRWSMGGSRSPTASPNSSAASTPVLPTSSAEQVAAETQADEVAPGVRATGPQNTLGEEEGGEDEEYNFLGDLPLSRTHGFNSKTDGAKQLNGGRFTANI